MKKRLFREKSMERVSSPEQLDDYIRVVNPGTWMILGAVFLFLASVFFWCVTATLAVTVEKKGYADGQKAYVFLDETEILAVQEGMDVAMEHARGKVASVQNMPQSYQEMADFLGGEGMAHALSVVEGDWKYKVTVSAPGVKKGVLDVKIITEQRNPISYLLQ